MYPNTNKILICSILNIHRSVLYNKSKLEEKDSFNLDKIKSTLQKHPYYGYPRISLELGINRKRVFRIMQNNGLSAKRRKKRKFIKENDIGFNHDQDFIIGTTKKAINKSSDLFGFLPCFLHSDQGSEYRGFKHLKLLEENGITPSMSKKSSPWENGLQEGFYGKLKLEIGNLNRFNSLEEAIEGVYSYIYYYNNNRIHTSIKMTPVAFRKQEQDKIKNDKNYLKNRNKKLKEIKNILEKIEKNEKEKYKK